VVVAVRFPFAAKIAITKEQSSAIIAGLIIMTIIITIRMSSALAAMTMLLSLEVSSRNSVKTTKSS